MTYILFCSYYASPSMRREVVGFSTAGVVKGSVAAAWHSSIGNVAGGSVFATLQSLGTYTVFSNPVTAAVVVVGAGVGSAYYCATRTKNYSKTFESGASSQIISNETTLDAY